jgi:hypothetical protein
MFLGTRRSWLLSGAGLMVLAMVGCKDKSPVKLTSPNDGPATEATYVEVSGKVLAQYMTRSAWTAGSGRNANVAKHSRSVVPLVDPSWKPGDPIPMWVSGAGQSRATSNWDDSLAEREKHEKAWVAALSAALAEGPIHAQITDRAGRKPNLSRGDSAETRAIAECVASHGITSAHNAPVLSWTGDPYRR